MMKYSIAFLASASAFKVHTSKMESCHAAAEDLANAGGEIASGRLQRLMTSISTSCLNKKMGAKGVASLMETSSKMVALNENCQNTAKALANATKTEEDDAMMPAAMNQATSEMGFGLTSTVRTNSNLLEELYERLVSNCAYVRSGAPRFDQSDDKPAAQLQTMDKDAEAADTASDAGTATDEQDATKPAVGGADEAVDEDQGEDQRAEGNAAVDALGKGDMDEEQAAKVGSGGGHSKRGTGKSKTSGDTGNSADAGNTANDEQEMATATADDTMHKVGANDDGDDDAVNARPTSMGGGGGGGNAADGYESYEGYESSRSEYESEGSSYASESEASSYASEGSSYESSGSEYESEASSYASESEQSSYASEGSSYESSGSEYESESEQSSYTSESEGSSYASEGSSYESESEQSSYASEPSSYTSESEQSSYASEGSEYESESEQSSYASEGSSYASESEQSSYASSPSESEYESEASSYASESEQSSYASSPSESEYESEASSYTSSGSESEYESEASSYTSESEYEGYEGKQRKVANLAAKSGEFTHEKAKVKSLNHLIDHLETDVSSLQNALKTLRGATESAKAQVEGAFKASDTTARKMSLKNAVAKSLENHECMELAVKLRKSAAAVEKDSESPKMDVQKTMEKVFDEFSRKCLKDAAAMQFFSSS